MSVLQLVLTRATLPAPTRVKSATALAAEVHRPRKPGCDDRTQSKYSYKYYRVKQQLFQALCFSRKLR